MRDALGIPAWLVRNTAQALILALAVTTVGPVLHGVHDDDCEPQFIVHDERQHHVQRGWPAAERSSPAHCVACHFARSFRGASSLDAAGTTPLDRSEPLEAAATRLYHAPSILPLPARAPPAVASAA